MPRNEQSLSVHFTRADDLWVRAEARFLRAWLNGQALRQFRAFVAAGEIKLLLNQIVCARQVGLAQIRARQVVSRKSAPVKFTRSKAAFRRSVFRTPAPIRSVSARIALRRSAPFRFAPVRFVPCSIAPFKFALNSIAPVRSALNSVALRRSAPFRFALLRSA